MDEIVRAGRRLARHLHRPDQRQQPRIASHRQNNSEPMGRFVDRDRVICQLLLQRSPRSHFVAPWRLLTRRKAVAKIAAIAGLSATIRISPSSTLKGTKSFCNTYTMRYRSWLLVLPGHSRDRRRLPSEQFVRSLQWCGPQSLDCRRMIACACEARNPSTSPFTNLLRLSRAGDPLRPTVSCPEVRHFDWTAAIIGLQSCRPTSTKST